MNEPDWKIIVVARGDQPPLLVVSYATHVSSADRDEGEAALQSLHDATGAECVMFRDAELTGIGGATQLSPEQVAELLRRPAKPKETNED